MILLLEIVQVTDGKGKNYSEIRYKQKQATRKQTSEYFSWVIYKMLHQTGSK